MNVLVLISKGILYILVWCTLKAEEVIYNILGIKKKITKYLLSELMNEDK